MLPINCMWKKYVPPAGGAIAFVQKTGKFTASAAASVTSGSMTTTSGNRAITTVAVYNGASLTFSDSKSNTWSADGTNNAGSGAGVQVASAQLSSAGSGHTFTVGSSGGTYFEGNSSEFSGIVTSSFVDTTGNTNPFGTTATVTTGASITNGGDLLIAVMAGDAGDSNLNISDPATTGFSSIGVNQDANATVGYQASYKILSGASGTQSATWTFDSAQAPCEIVAYKPA